MTSNALTVPAVALGTWAWGDSGEAGDGYFGSRLSESGLSESGLREVVETAQSNGFTLWDTAVAYGMGSSETVLGRALAGLYGGEYQLSTKFTPQLVGDGDDPVADMLAQSLDRMGTDYVDAYWIHHPADVERWTPSRISLLRSAEVRYVGSPAYSTNDSVVWLPELGVLFAGDLVFEGVPRSP